MPCPPPEDRPNPEIKRRCPTLQVDSLPSEPPGKLKLILVIIKRKTQKKSHHIHKDNRIFSSQVSTFHIPDLFLFKEILLKCLNCCIIEELTFRMLYFSIDIPVRKYVFSYYFFSIHKRFTYFPIQFPIQSSWKPVTSLSPPPSFPCFLSPPCLLTSLPL